MTLTILLDLDDTLLNTNLEKFVPVYFQALAKVLTPHIAPDLMVRALLSGIRKMNENEDFSKMLQDIFDAEFYSQVGISRGKLQAVADHYYDHVFPTLAGLTTQNPQAKPFVDWAFSQRYRIAIATDPLFPSKATHHRLRWAGFAGALRA